MTMESPGSLSRSLCMAYWSLAGAGAAALVLGCLVPYVIVIIENLQADLERDLLMVKIESDHMWDDLMAMSVDFPRFRRDYGEALTKHSGYTKPQYGFGYTRLKCCCSTEYGGLSHTGYNLATSYSCPVGYRGRQGEKGEPGQSGSDGSPGFNGEDFPSRRRSRNPDIGIPSSFANFELFDCTPCPTGPPGPYGPKGTPGPTGPNGERGVGGQHGTPGQPGKPGISGDNGSRGRPGYPGQRGSKGMDSIGGGKGTPGAKGQSGSRGAVGPRGMSGSPGTYGALGEVGIPGMPGAPGPRGQEGPRGLPGLGGTPGKDGIYCPCPAKSGYLVTQSSVPDRPIDYGSAPSIAYYNAAQPTIPPSYPPPLPLNPVLSYRPTESSIYDLSSSYEPAYRPDSVPDSNVYESSSNYEPVSRPTSPSQITGNYEYSQAPRGESGNAFVDWPPWTDANIRTNQQGGEGYAALRDQGENDGRWTGTGTRPRQRKHRKNKKTQ